MTAALYICNRSVELGIGRKLAFRISIHCSHVLDHDWHGVVACPALGDVPILDRLQEIRHDGGSGGVSRDDIACAVVFVAVFLAVAK
jgi:hypothetical protein